VTQVAVCSQINTKHINTVWEEHKIVYVKPVGGPFKDEKQTALFKDTVRTAL
jgi:hypothetical protein